MLIIPHEGGSLHYRTVLEQILFGARRCSYGTKRINDYNT